MTATPLLRQERAELLGRVSVLRSLEWLDYSPEEREALIRGFLRGYLLPPSTAFIPTAYRARLNEGQVLFEHMQDLMAPKPEYVSQNGRFNRAGCPTLYLCSQSISTMLEVRAQPDDLVTIVACRQAQEDELLRLAPVARTFARSPKLRGPLSRDYLEGAIAAPGFRDFLEQNGLLDQWLIQDQMVGRLLTLDLRGQKEQALYQLTNSIRDHLIEKQPIFEGFQYPSVANFRLSPNIALDQGRWRSIIPTEVWVARFCEDMLDGPPGSARLHTEPLHAVGSIGVSGDISYCETSRTLVAAVSDFKMRYGLIGPAPGHNLKPALIKPFVRHRISYDFAESELSYDFTLF